MSDSDTDSREPELRQGLLEATSLTAEDRWDEAFAVLCELEREFPDDAAVLCALGMVAAETEARGEAYDFFRRALALEPEDPHVLALLGAGLARYDDPEAERVLRLAAVTAPHLAVARLQYGAFLIREGMIEQGLAELGAARSLDPEDAGVVREIGVAHLLSGDAARGIEEIEAASDLAPDDSRIRFLLALSLAAVDRLPEAAEAAHRAAAELPNDGEGQALTALACASQEWWDEAWDALARAQAADPPPDPALLREIEDALEDGAPAARELLVNEVAPVLLRARLMARP